MKTSQPGSGFKPTPLRIVWQACLSASLLLGIFIPVLPARQTAAGIPRLSHAIQIAEPEVQDPLLEQAAALLEQMTPEERVGQLFLVTFKGSEAGAETEINDLIRNYFIGGVVLKAANDNFTEGSQAAVNALTLTRQLQTNRWESSRESHTNLVENESFIPAYVPLLIGIAQEGDGYQYDQLLNGIPLLTNQMALGATWDTELAKQSGAVLGDLMTRLGVNLIFGPTLDVLETPRTDSASDLGTRTFGGDPFWVSTLGQAFIEGLHQGSSNQVAVIAKHFPGYGGSDRLPEVEVATVRKSLDQLLDFELSPFFNVTGDAPSEAATVDGLLTGHIRYQGFQGNIRSTTRPVSFDPQALKLLLNLPQIDSWRQGGGVMVSDDLGGQAVRGFYDLTSQAFDMPRRVALNAFLAGNDLLYISDFSSGELDSINSAKRTLEFFAQKYREDPAFGQRVDESVLRILALKFRLYQTFGLDNVLANPEELADLQPNDPVTFQVARQAAMLISPSEAELDETIPEPPSQAERIVFITDTRAGKQCTDCAEFALVDQRALEQAVLRLYGPQSGGQVVPANLSSFSMSDLEEMLNLRQGTSNIERALRRAQWIVFLVLDASLKEPSFQTLSQFLTERPDLFQNKKQIVFALNAPYYLDATNISKLTAYYGLFGKLPEFIDTGAYILFQELRPEGASPVSIPGISYDLAVALFPDPDQVIPLEIELLSPESTESQATPTPATTTVYRIGDVITVRTGTIVDQNGHPVPDGTPVEFTFNLVAQGGEIRQVGDSINGVAFTTFTISDSGVLEIQAVSEPAASDSLKLDIPSPFENGTPQPTETPTPTLSPTPTSTPTPPASDLNDKAALPGPAFGDWIMALLLSAAVGWGVFKWVSNAGFSRWGIRTGFLALIGGLAAYIYLALELPGSTLLADWPVTQAVFLVTIGGALVGAAAALVWRSISSASAPSG